MKIGIVGWGVEGQSAYRFFGPEHSYLIVNEQPSNDFPPESERIKLQFLNVDHGYGLRGSVEDLSYLDGIESCDKIIYTPTAFLNLQKKFRDNKDFWNKAVTAQHIFFEEVQTRNIIGVTGTKGKGTTSTLIAKMLEAALRQDSGSATGKKVYLGGNIGRSVLDFVRDVQPDDWVVLELASFQLKSLTYSPHIAVCLMIAPEHLDWHPDVDNYVEAKANIFKHQKPEDIAIYFAKDENSKKIAAYSPGKKVPYFEPPGAYVREDGMIVLGSREVIYKSKIKLLGEHNLQNICAALTAVFEALGSLDKVETVLSSFSGLEHRLELVRSLEGVKYYNDSFAATPDATIGAMEAIPGPKIMIIGGFERQLPLDKLVNGIRNHGGDVKMIVLIGQSAERVAENLRKVGFEKFTINKQKTMPAILSRIKESAQSGDSVILSPGFASFDMFKDFEVRGQQFKAAVNSL